MSREPTSQENPVHFSIFIEKDLQQNPLVTVPSSLNWQVYEYVYKDNDKLGLSSAKLRATLNLSGFD